MDECFLIDSVKFSHRQKSYAVAQSYHVREFKQRSKENARLRKLIAELSPDKANANKQELP